MAKNKILKNVSIIVVFSLFAKLSSFLVDLLIASRMGADRETDAFYMVYGIVQIVYPMISVGIWKVFLPEYKIRTVRENIKEASEFTSQILTIFVIIAIVIVGVVSIFPQYILYAFAPGFDEDTLNVSQSLIRIVIFILIFNIISTFSAAILQSWQEFSKAQLKDVIIYIPSLVYLLLNYDSCSITGLAYSILLGGILASLVTYGCTRKKYKYSFPKKMWNTSIYMILQQVPMACLNSIINQLNNIIDKAFASILPVGAITYLTYGGKIIHLFDGMLSTAVSTALFPNIAEIIAKKDYDRLKKFEKNYMALIGVFLIPVTFWLVIYSKDVVQGFFGYGKFDAEAIEQTGLVLLMYGIGLFFMALTTMINDIFFIVKRTNILLMTTIINIFLNIIFDFLFIEKWSVAGLSLASTISLFVVLVFKFYFIRDIYCIDKELLKLWLKICSCSASASLLVFITNYYFISADVYSRLLLGSIIFALVYIVIAMVSSEQIRRVTMQFFSKVSWYRDRCLLLECIRGDYQNNSFRSFMVLLFYRLLHHFYYRKHFGIRFIFIYFVKYIIFTILMIDAQISYKASIGKDIRLPHSAMGVVISSKAIIEDNQTIYHQVTIGINEKKTLDEQKIIIHKNCYLSAGCKVISCEIGENSKIGPNAVVYHDLPNDSLYVSANQLIRPK